MPNALLALVAVQAGALLLLLNRLATLFARSRRRRNASVPTLTRTPSPRTSPFR